MKTKLSLFLMLSMLALPMFTHAKTSSTTESIAIQSIVSGIRAYQTLKGGQTPTNWMTMREIMDIDKLNSQTLANSSAYPIEEHYVFITQKIPVPSYPNGDVILIRTSPVQSEEQKAGRYMISMVGNAPSYRWIEETEVQQMLADAGVKELPKPEPVVAPADQSTKNDPAPAIRTTTEKTPPDGEKPRVTRQDARNYPEPKHNRPNTTNTVPSKAETATPGNATSWLGLIVVLGIGFVFSIFLLFRAKQK